MYSVSLQKNMADGEEQGTVTRMTIVELLPRATRLCWFEKFTLESREESDLIMAAQENIG